MRGLLRRWRRRSPRAPSAVRGAFALAALALAALLASGCASWSTTRERVVDPIHALLHHEWPAALEAGDRRHLDPLFHAPTREAALAPSLALLERFERIDDARVAIETVDLEAEPVVARVSLRANGVGRDGALETLLQDKVVTLAREGDRWSIASDDSGPLRDTPKPPVHFTEEGALRGLRFVHEAGRVVDPKGVSQRYIYGSGVAAADVDGDGWEDALLLSGTRIELFRNRSGYFERVSEAWGLGGPFDGILTIALPLDFDGDGRRDLFVGRELAPPLLFRNAGDRFVPVPDAGLETRGRTISAAAADFDGDGDVDLYLANHEDVYWKAPKPPGAADNAQPDQLFLNRGDGTFSDATEASGIRNTGWSLTPVAADYDDDGDVDLFVGNDFGADLLYRNDGHAHFEEVSTLAGVDKPVASMSADWGDFDGDGDMDLFIGGMRSGSAWVLDLPEFRVEAVPWIVDALFRPYVRQAIRAWFRGNRLYENRGDGTFTELAAESGAGDSGWAWSTVWLDFDNDGRLDLYGANGFISGAREDDL